MSGGREAAGAFGFIVKVCWVRSLIGPDAKVCVMSILEALYAQWHIHVPVMAGHWCGEPVTAHFDPYLAVKRYILACFYCPP